MAKISVSAEGTDPKEDKKELHELFAMFDKDGIGKMSVRDVADLMRCKGSNPTVREEEGWKNDLDDGTGIVGWGKLWTYMSSRLPNHQQNREVLMKAFNNFDKDKDGYLDVAELKDAMGTLGKKLTMEEAEDLLASYDDDMNGYIDIDELAHILGTV